MTTTTNKKTKTIIITVILTIISIVGVFELLAMSYELGMEKICGDLAFYYKSDNPHEKEALRLRDCKTTVN